MIPKLKAIELVKIFGKELAIKAVDEIITEIKSIEKIFKKDTLLIYYWTEVKSEIEKL